jgi:uncharacterized protein
MDITLDSSNSRYLIRAYESGRLKINEEFYTESVIVTPEQLQLWTPPDFNTLSPIYLEELLNLSPEVVLLGTGIKGHMISPEWLMIFYQKHIGVEVMDTHAACRTFNVLAAEGRKVVAGLLIA